MSSHYTLTFTVKLKRGLTGDQIETLHHLFNAEKACPKDRHISGWRGVGVC